MAFLGNFALGRFMLSARGRARMAGTVHVSTLLTNGESCVREDSGLRDGGHAP